MSTTYTEFLAQQAELEARIPVKDGAINAATLRALLGRASMLAAQPPGSDRAADDAHDLLNTVIGILEDNGLALITDAADIETAFTATHI